MRSCSLPCILGSAAIVLVGCGGEEPVGTIGLACDESSAEMVCGPSDTMRCAMGFELLADDDTPDDDDDVDGAIGLLMPPGQGYCMQNATCEDDADCPRGSACYRPLANVAPADRSGLPFDANDLFRSGQCLKTCTDSSDCREAEGFVCAVPLAEELAGIPGVQQDTFCIPEPIAPPCTPDPARSLPGTCTLTYDLAGEFEITGAPIASANGVKNIGPGALIVRVPSADGESITDGDAAVLCLDMPQRFALAGVFTNVRAYARSTGSDALNSGTLSGTTITWDECTYSATHCQNNSSWTPDAPASGPGCLAGYHSIGDVECTLGVACALGSLMAGHNPQTESWTQPFNHLVFSDDFGTVSMSGDGSPESCTTPSPKPDRLEIPNRTPTRTWLSFTGTLRSMECTAP